MDSRSLPYISDPSVATVTMASSGPRSSSLAVLIEATTLQMLDRPKWRRVSMTAPSTPNEAMWASPSAVPNAIPSSSQAESETPMTTSVLVTLWIRGMCLSPIPWMLCSPNPL